MSARLSWDGALLTAGDGGPGRVFGLDPRCLEGPGVRGAGAITVARSPRWFSSDPFARLFAGHVVRTDLFAEVPPPPGPVMERYGGTPWPGGAFPAA